MLDTVLEIARYSLPVLAVAVLALCLSALLKRRAPSLGAARLINTANGDSFPLVSRETSLGRHKNCDIVLNYSTVSRQHAVVVCAKDGWYITGVKTGSEVLVNGKKTEKKEWKYDFTPNGVDLNSFPYNVWRRLAKDSLLDDRAEMFRLGDSQGEYGLRSAISRYLYQARGVNAHPDQIIIGAGNDYLLMLLSTVIGQNHKVALENPTYKQAYRLFKSLSYDVCTVDMDEKGMKVANLKSSGADIAFVMPSHQYPLGIVMPMKRRMELLKWAAKDPARYIIEDDYDSEFRYKGKPIPALQGYDRWEKVIYIGTFSKSIAPSIRVSYMVLPVPLLKEFQKKSSFLSSTVSRVDQLILQKFIEDGHYERHLNRIRTLYKSRHDTLMGCLKTFQKICTISGENAGVHILLHFVGDMTEEELIRKAAEKGVRVYGLSQYYIDPPDGLKPTIMLGYANISEAKMKEAVKLLEEAWK